MEDARRQPDLSNYLTYLLITESSASVDVRATAGLLLKNNIYSSFPSLAPEVLDYVKGHIIQGLVDPAVLIRNITGNVVTTLLAKAGVSGWPEALGSLMTMSESSSLQQQEGAMSALAKICEDSASELDREYDGQRPLTYMIPKFLSYTQSSSPKVRALSIFCLTQFITVQSQSLLAHVDNFLNALFGLATDSDSDTRRNICTALVSLLEVRPEKLLPHLDGVINYCLHCLKDEDEQVASEACEFILGVAESNIDESLIRPHLSKILPAILSTMVYSEMDRFLLEGLAENDEAEADKAEDIRPSFAKSKDAHHAAEKKEKKDDNEQTTTSLEDIEDEDEDEDDDYEAGLAEWNLRKCSAAALDVFAVKFPDSALENLMPYLKENVVSDEWYVREAAILAFGAISLGAIAHIDQHLPSLIPFLIDRLNDEQPPVRQIACWTLSRYSKWISDTNIDGSNPQQYFLPCLEGLLRCCLDKNKKVQESGCSAVATFCDTAGELLAPYVGAVLRQLVMCFQKYQAKNLIILYDALQTLVDRIPDDIIAQPEYVDILLPPLIGKWQQLKDDDRELWPLLECLSSVTASLREQFAPYAPEVFMRCINILQQNLALDQYAQVDPSIDPPEKDFIITTLDLLDGMVIGLGGHSSELIARYEPSLVEMMLVCFEDDVYEVRQSAFALLGDMAINTYDRLEPYLNSVMQETIKQADCRDPGAQAVCNNAIWSLGELSLRVPAAQLEPFANELLQRLVTILQSPTSETILENAAIAIGRLGRELAGMIAPHLDVFIQAWCVKIRNVDETDEKDSAFLGMCHIIAANPNSLTSSGGQPLIEFLQLCAYYEEPSQELAMSIAKVLEGYKNFLGSNWNDLMGKLHPEVAQSLTQRYGL